MSNPSDVTYTAKPPDTAHAAEEEIARYLRRAVHVVLVLIVGLGGWAAITSIGGAVIAPGAIAVESDVKSVQHPEGGIIAEILVRDGDQVEAGVTLLKFDASDLLDEISGLEQQLAARDSEATLFKEELAVLEPLESKGLVTKNRITGLRREIALADGERGRLGAQLARAKGRLGRAEVRAPIAGTIHNLAFATIGGVVNASEEILRIIPSEDQLIIDARLNPSDVDQVSVGQQVSVRFPGLNQRTTPELPGAVDFVSADLTLDETRKISFYEVRIRLDADAPRQIGGVKLVPGMPADAFIQMQSRTVLSYLLQPLTDQFSRAFREE